MRILISWTLFYFWFLGPSLSAQTQGDFAKLTSRIISLKDQGAVHDQVCAMVNAEAFLSTMDIDETSKGQAYLQLAMSDIDLEALTKAIDEDAYEIGITHEYGSIAALMKGDFEGSVDGFNSALRILDNYGYAYRVHRWLGLIHGMTENISASIHHYLEAIETAQDYFYADPEKGRAFIFSLHSNVFSAYSKQGNLIKANYHIDRAFEYATILNDSSFVFTAIINKANILLQQEDSDASLNLLLGASDYVNDFNPATINYYNLLGVTYFRKRMLEQSIDNFEKSNRLIKNESVHLSSRILNKSGIAEVLYAKGDYNKAIVLLDEIIEHYKGNQGEFYASLSDAYYLRSRCYLKLDQLIAAKSDAYAALEINGPFDAWKILHHANLVAVYGSYFNETNDEQYLDSLELYMNVNDQFILDVRDGHQLYDGDIELNRYVHDAYVINLEVLGELYENNTNLSILDNVLKYVEGVKAFSLGQILKTDDAVRIGQLPNHVLDVERSMQFGLINLEKSLFRTSDEDLRLGLERKLNEQKRDYYDYLKNLSVAYPDYYKIQFNNDSIDLQGIQKQLASDEVIIDYFITDDRVYKCAVLKNDILFKSQLLPVNWDLKLDSFVMIMSDPGQFSSSGQFKNGLEQFSALSYELYDVLLADVIAVLPSEITKIKVIPDNELLTIPFEVLLTAKDTELDSYKDLSYLLMDYDISYAQSLDYLLYSNAAGIYETNYTGLIGDYSSSSHGQLAELPATQKAIEQTADEWGGLLFTKGEGQINSTMSLNSTVVHIGAHGIVNKEVPILSAIQFGSAESTKLYAADIFSMDLASQLVILAACNTGTGKMIRGDGLMSLSRAFSFAGARSTVTSLWSIPDAQTAELSSLFLNNLKDHPIDQSLNRAKEDYLMQSHEMGAHPFFWAGMIVNGETSGMLYQKGYDWYLIALILAVLLLLLAMYWKPTQ